MSEVDEARQRRRALFLMLLAERRRYARIIQARLLADRRRKTRDPQP